MVELAADCIRGGAHARAVKACTQVLQAAPTHAGALRMLGVAHLAMGQAGLAVAALREAVANDGQNPQVHFLLGEALSQTGDMAAALASLRQAVRLQPGHGAAHHALAGIYRRNVGEMKKAADHLRQAMAAEPEVTAHHSSLLLTMHYSLDWSPDEVAAEHRAFGARFADAGVGVVGVDVGATDSAAQRSRPCVLEQPAPDHTDDSAAAAPLSVAPIRQPLGRKLRIGYVSADFREHPVACFIEAPLGHHDRQRHEIVCYADVARPDATTARLADCAGHWRDISALSDAQVAEKIMADRIDILVDLSGHSGKNRLAVFAMRAAPVQVTYLGYPDTTGLTAMDYRLVDAITDPPGVADQRHSERLMRLPDCFLCYTPRADAPPVAPPPCLAHGGITFGSFNNFAKISPQWVALVARVLQAVPGSRCLLKSPYARSNDGGREQLLARFAACDIAPERVAWRPFESDPNAHLVRYGEVDVALDTYPYHGTTTTCEALWMGVPVVSLTGETHAARVGASLLNAAGLPELAVACQDEFVRQAAALAAKPDHLAQLRQGMWERLQTLTDGAAFTRRLEQAYASMWEAK